MKKIALTLAVLGISTSAFAEPTTQAALISKYNIPITTINKLTTSIVSRLKAGEFVSLEGYGNIVAPKKPSGFYFTTTASDCVVNWTANVETCNLDPTKTAIEFGSAPKYYNATQMVFADSVKTDMGDVEWSNYVTKFIPGFLQELKLNVAGVQLDNLGVFMLNINTKGIESLGFNGIKKATLP